jgi:hypothetical protein
MTFCAASAFCDGIPERQPRSCAFFFFRKSQRAPEEKFPLCLTRCEDLADDHLSPGDDFICGSLGALHVSHASTTSSGRVP